uniref:helix-turn-helix domain-containing protein n=1 Tax=Pedobacter schmidteae TaxID=2201271 RepID=UPI000EADA094|nr:helix-turn-helix domain-containing protein [Pedobacter schmidteae]
MLLKIINLLLKILNRLNQIEDVLMELRAATTFPVEDELLDNSDVKRLLKVGDSTLYRWRKKKMINTQLIGGKYYYLKSSLTKLLEKK